LARGQPSIPVDDVVIDGSLYPRAKGTYNEFHLKRLMDAFDSGIIFPPILLERNTNRLVDGLHRLELHKRKEIERITCTFRVYPNDEELLAEAARINNDHGLQLTLYDNKDLIRRLGARGYARDAIATAVRMVPEKVDEIIKGFAMSMAGEPVALKGGLGHKRAQILTPAQEQAVRNYGGNTATIYVKHLLTLLDNEMWPAENVTLRNMMDRLCSHWCLFRGFPDPFE
jgi:hypothetical protein